VLELLTGPSVKLDNIRANVKYERVTNDADGSRKNTLGGFIEGHIEMCGLHIWARYERNSATGVSTFTGLLTREKFDPSHSQTIGLSGLGDAVQIPRGEWVTPPELKLPEDFRVSAVGVTFIPNQCLEIYARGTQIWTGQFAGLELEVKELTALLRRKWALEKRTRAFKVVYEVFFTGELVFEGFVSAKAWLSLSNNKSRGSTLTALITKVSVVVINFDTDVEGLRKLLVLKKPAGTEQDGEIEVLDTGKLPQGEPPIVPDTPEAASIAETSTQGLSNSTKVGRHAWFFITAKMDNNPQRPMTEARHLRPRG
jgi:hypothetical protein